MPILIACLCYPSECHRLNKSSKYTNPTKLCFCIMSHAKFGTTKLGSHDIVCHQIFYKSNITYSRRRLPTPSLIYYH